MFSVLFEVNPHTDQWTTYLDKATMLRPELEKIDGFVDNIRYRSLTRDGWILSLSNWRDEKALIRWRTHARHHDVQAQGRDHILADYHLRVGQITADTHIPAGHQLLEQRLDETETGKATTITLINASQTPEWTADRSTDQIATSLGLDPTAPGLVGWDIFDAVLQPGNLILMLAFTTPTKAAMFTPTLPEDRRRRDIRIIRDYGKYDRHESPQYYPDAQPPNSSIQPMINQAAPDTRG